MSQSYYDPSKPTPCETCQWHTACQRLELSCKAFISYSNTGRWKATDIDPSRKLFKAMNVVRASAAPQKKQPKIARFSGKPCIKCGSTDRYLKTKNCASCDRKRRKKAHQAKKGMA